MKELFVVFLAVPLISIYIEGISTGSTSYEACEKYVKIFNPVVNKTIHGLFESYTSLKMQLYGINISLPTDIYLEALRNISEPWHDMKFPAIASAINLASNLTGFPGELIVEVMNNIDATPKYPLSCIVSQFKELISQFYAFEGSLNEQRQVLEATNYRVKKAHENDLHNSEE